MKKDDRGISYIQLYGYSYQPPSFLVSSAVESRHTLTPMSWRPICHRASAGQRGPEGISEFGSLVVGDPVNVTVTSGKSMEATIK